MTIRFKCPHCGTRTKVADAFAGQVASCARCGRFMIVPGGQQLTPPAAVVVDEPPDTPAAPADASAHRTTFSGVSVLAFVVLAIACVAMVYWLSRTVDSETHYVRCSQNLKTLGLALHNYHDLYGCLPPAYTTDENGRPMHSWRVLLLPFINQSHLYRQFRLDEPWDSPHNIALMDQMPWDYVCVGKDVQLGLSNYVVVIGSTAELPETLFAPERGVQLSDVQDDLAETIMVAEVARGVPWTMPLADLEFRSMTMRVNQGPASLSSDHGTVNVLMGDGSVQAISHSFETPELLQSRLLANDGPPRVELTP